MKATANTVHSESFNIRASEVDPNGKATLPAICALFQEVAGNNALMLNFDISQLQERNLTWVLHRMNIKMKDYPKWRDEITIETWPSAGDSLKAYRDYRIKDSSGNELGTCLSYWMMLNTQNRRPVRMPEEILDMRIAGKDHVMEVKKNKLKPVENHHTKKIFTVRNSDLDMNKHVNNARYVEWMLEAHPQKQMIEPREMDIVFLKECYYGEVIISQAENMKDKTTRHQLSNNSGDLIALAEVTIA